MSPLKPTRISSDSPMIQLMRRGRRYAPVKNIRSRWIMRAATKTSAAQWCTWRISRPARTFMLRLTTEL